MKTNIISLVIFIISALLFLDACGADQIQKTDDGSTQSMPTFSPENQNITITPAGITPTNPINFQISPSVQDNPPTVTLVSNNSQNLQYRWLNGIPCRPPCWEGITPGKTSATEALQLLNKSPLIAVTNRFEQDPKEKLAAIGWNWIGKPALSDTISEGGRIFYDYKKPNEPVVNIRPNYIPNSFKIKDIIQAYGEPNYVSAGVVFPAEGKELEYAISFIYIDLGFIANTSWFLPKPAMPTLTEDVSIKREIIFFEPGLQKLSELFNVPQISTILVPWQGFKDFDFYCRRSDGSKCKYTR